MAATAAETPSRYPEAVLKLRLRPWNLQRILRPSSRLACRLGSGWLLATCILHAQMAPPAALPPAQQGSLSTAQTTLPSLPGTISGEVIDIDGAVIEAAHVSLITSSVAATTTTDHDGRYFFRNVPSGSFSVSVTLSGFNAAVEPGILQPGETMELPEISLSVATVATTVNAMTQEQAGIEELHTEEHQRLVGVLPNFFVSYSWTAPPLTTRQKFILSWRNAVDPGNLALSGTVAGIQQAENEFPGYHQGAVGYGKRLGADYANLWAGTFMGGAVLPTLFHQDPRYFYKGTGTLRARFFYSITRAVICRGDNGRWQPNYSGVLGDLSAGAISNIYYPASDRHGVGLTFANGFLGVAGDALNGFVQEFILPRFTTHGKKAPRP